MAAGGARMADAARTDGDLRAARQSDVHRDVQGDVQGDAHVVGQPDTGEDRTGQVARGGEVFQATCAACHGTRLTGSPAAGRLDGGALVDTDLALVDLTLRTGRMPIAAPSLGVRVEELSDDDREAVLAYLVETFGLTGTIPEVGVGDASRGQERYIRNCAACHGAAADGGISGANVRVPGLVGLDPVAIAEAVRVGPFEMPAFDAAVLDDEAVADIAAYLGVVDAAPRTALGVRELDQVGEALFALGLALLVALVVWVVARARHWSPSEPGGAQHAPPFEPRR